MEISKELLSVTVQICGQEGVSDIIYRQLAGWAEEGEKRRDGKGERKKERERECELIVI